MKKHLIIFFSLLLSFGAYAQLPQKITTWTEFSRIGGTLTMTIPLDTVGILAAHKTKGYIARKGDVLYVWSPSQNKWVPVSGGTGGGTTVVGSEYNATQLNITSSGTSEKSDINTAFARSDINTIVFDKGNITLAAGDTVRVPAGKTLSFRNGAQIVGGGVITGGIIDASYSNKIFGTAITVIDIENSIRSVRWWGANPAATGAVNIVAFRAAITSVTLGKRTAVYMPSGDVAEYYQLGDSLLITKNIELYGDGKRTKLLFDGTKLGIKVAGGSASGAYLHDFEVRGSAGTVSRGINSPTAHGIWLSATLVIVERVVVWSFNGNGFQIAGDVNVGTNANLCRLTNTESNGNGNSGYYLQGGDANSCTIDHPSAVGNSRFGIWDASFLGNTIITPHIASNGMDHNFNKSVIKFNGDTYFARVDNINSRPPIGASNGTWENIGVLFPPFFTNWDSTTQFFSGGSINISDPNAQSTVIGPYREGDQPAAYNNGRSVFLGGFGSELGGFAGAIGNRNGVLTSKNFQAYDPSNGIAIQLQARNGEAQLNYIDRNENTWGLAGEAGGVSFSWNGLGIRNIVFASPKNNNGGAVGRDVSSFGNGGAALFKNGVWLGDDNAGDSHRQLRYGTSVPTTGNYGVGDIIINNRGTNNILWWQCTVASVAGNGGTWIARSGGSGGTPAGASGQVQINSGGAFGASDAAKITNEGLYITPANGAGGLVLDAPSGPYATYRMGGITKANTGLSTDSSYRISPGGFGSAPFTMLKNGNIGIGSGNTAPTFPLDVLGNAKFSVGVGTGDRYAGYDASGVLKVMPAPSGSSFVRGDSLAVFGRGLFVVKNPDSTKKDTVNAYIASATQLGIVRVGANLSVDAAGVLSATAGGGTPAGATGQIQFNNAGAFGANANATISGGIISAGSETGVSGEIRSIQSASGGGYLSLKTDHSIFKSGLFRGPATGYPFYYNTGTGNSVIDATFGGSGIDFDIQGANRASISNAGNFRVNALTGTGDRYTGVDLNGVFKVMPAPSSTYTLPIASATVLGGIKIGSGLAIDGGGILTATGTSTDISGKADKTSLPVNAKDAPFNAVGNGVANDRAALQAAADFAQANKRRLYIPAGTYRTTTSVGDNIVANLFLKPGADIFGDGDATVILRTDSLLGYAIAYDKTAHNAAALVDRNYTIKNLKIKGASTGLGYEAPGATDRDGGIFLANATGRSNKVLIENVTAERFNKEAIAVWDAVSIQATNNHVFNTNHDAYNFQKVDNLLMTNNYADNVNFGLEYEGFSVTGVPTIALIDHNIFTNVREYGINVEAGNKITVSNNTLSGYEGTTSVTGVSVGVYIAPHVDTVYTLNITDNKISNFIQYGIGTGAELTTDFLVRDLTIKDNTITRSGSNAIHLLGTSTAKFGRTEISGNTMYDWNRIDNGNSFQWSAIDINGLNDVDIFGNRSYNITNGKRNDPLRINNTANVKYFNNDVTGPPSQFNSTLAVLQQGTNTGVVVYNNEGLAGNGTAPGTPTLASGTYTPTVTNGVNVATNTVTTALYTRIGDYVTVSGTINFTYTAASTNSKATLSLPFATTATMGLQDLAGVITGGINESGTVLFNTTTTLAEVLLNPTTTGGGYKYVYTYKIK